MIGQRLLCLFTGYLLGCLLTAQGVARLKTGAGAWTLGTGNPGAANLTGQLGLKWGALVLAGDCGKAILACLACRLLLAPDLGPLALYHAGLGAVLGHNFPFWHRWQGGKGVAVTCTVQVLAAPLWGSLSCLAGLAVVVLSGFVPLGAVVIPALFVPISLWRYGPEAGLIALLWALIMLSRHLPGLRRMAAGQERRAFRPKQ